MLANEKYELYNIITIVSTFSNKMNVLYYILTMYTVLCCHEHFYFHLAVNIYFLSITFKENVIVVQ